MTFAPGDRVTANTAVGPLAGTVRAVRGDGGVPARAVYVVELDGGCPPRLFFAAALRPLPAADQADAPLLVHAAAPPPSS